MVCFCCNQCACYLSIYGCLLHKACGISVPRPGRDGTRGPRNGSVGLNQWTASKVPMEVFSFDHTSTFNLLILAINVSSTIKEIL